MVSLRCVCSSLMFELASFSCWRRTTTRRPHHRDKVHAPARPFGLLYTSVLLSQKSTDRYRDRAKILTEIAQSIVKPLLKRLYEVKIRMQREQMLYKLHQIYPGRAFTWTQTFQTRYIVRKKFALSYFRKDPSPTSGSFGIL